MGKVKNVACLLNSLLRSRLLPEFFFLFDLKFCFWFRKEEVLFRIFFSKLFISLYKQRFCKA